MTVPRFALLTSLALLAIAAFAQEPEGAIPTQVLVHAVSKSDVALTPTDIKIELNSKLAPVSSLVPIKPSGLQIALLIDDGLSRSSGLQLDDLQKFANSVPAGTELLVGYMTNGTVQIASPFTADHQATAAAIRIPMGTIGQSASPYFCLSDFVKHWPGSTPDGPTAKARVVMMITNGVDPYNGSTGMGNQDSPYVAAAVKDAQRAGVSVYSIYYRDAGYRGGGSAPLSGQSYLLQVADGTGGESFYEGTGSPISLQPFFKQFTHDLAETYVATFSADAQAGGRDHLVRLKMSSTIPKLKLRVQDEVRPGNVEAAVAPAAGQ